jgi:UDP-glucose 4-epimerase
VPCVPKGSALTWIVTGGAGYIGAHVVHRLRPERDLVVFDDLSTGRADRVPGDVPVVQGSVTDPEQLRRLFAAHPAEGVIHLAARKAVGQSVHDPDSYERHNVTGVRNLLAAMRNAGIPRLLFASSAAVYGDMPGRPAHEDDRLRPASPYGVTKATGENLVDAERDRGLSAMVFRQFNVVGAGEHPYAADAGRGSLLPAVFRSLTEEDEPLSVLGKSYPTRDGSAVRDYVHADDVARAYVHGVRVLMRAEEVPKEFRTVNVGSGVGHSVFEMLQIVGDVLDRPIPHEVGPRRPGDASEVVADVHRAEDLGLAARRSLTDAVASAWASWRRFV